MEKGKIVRMALIFAVAAVSICFAYNEKAEAQNYYIATDGNDSSDGSKKAPFATFSHAISKLTAGDTLYVRGGNYNEQICIPAEIRGEGKKRIRIRAYGSEEAIIDGDGKNVHLLEVNGASGVTVEKLKFANAEGNESAGICIYPESTDIKLIKNEIYDIAIKGDADEDNNANGIIVFGESAKEIKDIEIKKNYIHDLQTGYSEAVSVTGNCENINITGNRVENISNIGIDCSGNYGYCPDPGKDYPRNCRIERNTVENCVSAYATSYGIYADGAQKVEIRCNTVENCGGGIEIGAENAQSVNACATGDVLVEKNKISDNKDAAIAIGGYEKNLGLVGNVIVKNNTCRRNGDKDGAAMLILSKCANIDISKNKFYNDNGKGDVLYSEMSKEYTYDIKFSKNLYSNNDNDSFVLNNRSLTELDGWKKK